MNEIISLPKPKIKKRKLNMEIERSCLKQGLHPLLASIIASRLQQDELDLTDILLPKLAILDTPDAMQDIKKGAHRLAKAIINKEYIGIETDHDCDGQTSHAVIYYNLSVHFKHPLNKIYSYIGHRLNEGYGLSDPVADRILQDKPNASLIITADNGSSDEPRIKRLKEAGIDVIVTDHHEIPVEGGPKSAYACLNPAQSNCNYKDKYIAGCMVAWLLMVATRVELITLGYLTENAPKLIDSLDFVAVGTIADCVSMAQSKNNRAVVAYGLKYIQAGTRPCWRAIKLLLNNQITTVDLAFRVAPLLNSDGRLATAFGSVSFLLAENDLIAREWITQLQELNKQRKIIQKNITIQGLKQAISQVKSNCKTVTIYLEDGHTGVHGISASRIKEYFGRPTAFFAPRFNKPEILAGSIRGIDNFHVRNALQFIADLNNSLFITFGGHKGAGGVTLKRENFSTFVQLFEQAAKEQLGQAELGPIIWTDGELPKEWISLDTLQELNKLEPFGREFELPIFQTQAKLINFRTIGDGTHARVILEIKDNKDDKGNKDNKNNIYNGVWFGMRQSIDEPITVNVGDNVVVAYSLRLNEFNGAKKCELQIIYMQKE